MTMAGNKSATPTGAMRACKNIPRYVQNLNALAKQHGLSVRVYADHYSDDPDRKLILFAEWTGTEAQLRSLPIVPPRWRAPMTTGQLICGGDCWHHHPTLRGYVTPDAESAALCYEIDFGEVPRAIKWKGAVEIVESAGEIAYHGTFDELVAIGIDRKRIPTGERGSRRSTSLDEPTFQTRRQPDGSYLHWVETEESFQGRQEARQRSHAPRAEVHRPGLTASTIEPGRVVAWMERNADALVHQQLLCERSRPVGRQQRLMRWTAIGQQLIIPDWPWLRAARLETR
jgi:hypothetical protein